MRWWRRASPDPGADPDPVPPDLLAWANTVDATLLSDKTVKNAERFLRDYRHMTNLGARRESALRLRSAIEAQVSPPPPATIANVDIIAVALSARRKQLGIE
jgi:hypothetical protein